MKNESLEFSRSPSRLFDMLPLKAASSKESVSAWEIVLKCYLSAFVFFALSRCVTCEPSSLFSTRNSSAIFSPLQSVFLTSTPNLAGVAYGQTLLSPPKQMSLETAINSVNDGFISQFGVYTGDNKLVTIRTTQALSSSSLNTNAPIVEATQASHTVRHPLQSENRNAWQSARGGAETQNLQTLQLTRERSTMETILSTVVKSSYMQDTTNSRMRSKIISALGNIDIDISPTRSLPVNIAHTALLQSSFKLSRFSLTSEPERSQSISFSHKKFTDSVSRLTFNLHVASNMLSTDDLSPGINRNKSTFLSHYSTGTARQVQSISGALSSRVLQTLVSPSSAVPRKSSSSASSAVWHNSTSTLSTAAITKDYSSSIITAMLRDLSSFTSPTSFTSTAFDSYSKSGSAKHNINSTRATTASSFATIIRFTSVQPSLPSSVAVKDKPILTCKVNNFSCACFNCHQARKNGKTCCQDVIDRTNIQQGVIMNMAHITIEKFHQKVSNVSHVLAEVILDSCISNSTRCFSNEKSSEKTAIRKKRSLETDFLEDFSSSNSIKTKKEADSDVFMSQTLSSSVSKEALHLNINSSKSNISRVDVIIYSISSKSGLPHRVETAFYVTVTSNISGTNLAQVLDGKGLIQILRDKKGTLEDRLNLTIESFSASQSKTEPTSLPFDTTLVPNASPGRENQQTSLSTPQGRNFVTQRSKTSVIFLLKTTPFSQCCFRAISLPGTAILSVSTNKSSSMGKITAHVQEPFLIFYA